MNSDKKDESPQLTGNVTLSEHALAGIGNVTYGIVPTVIHRCLHPHDDAVRIRVLEKMFEELVGVLVDQSIAIHKTRPIQQTFSAWLAELKDSKYVDVVYTPHAISYDLNGDSLPYQLKLPNLMQVKKDSKGE